MTIISRDDLFDEILYTIAEYYEVEPEDIVSKEKKEEYKFPRLCLIYFCKIYGIPMLYVAVKINRKYTTVYRANDKCVETRKYNVRMYNDIKNIETLLLEKLNTKYFAE